jgi:hypothetical protein
MLPTIFRYIWPNGFRWEEFKKSTKKKEVDQHIGSKIIAGALNMLPTTN